MTKLSSLLSGIIFGLGLTISGMVNPEKVLGFLNIFDAWDPSLMFVMIGAILIFSPLHFIFKRKSKPIFAKSFFVPSNKDIDIADICIMNTGGLRSTLPDEISPAEKQKKLIELRRDRAALETDIYDLADQIGRASCRERV